MAHPDYRRWLTLFDRVPESRRREAFRTSVFRHLATYRTGNDLCAFMAANKTWMKELGTPNSNFETMLAALRADPNGTTLKLSDFVKIHAATIITIAWQKHVADAVARYKELAPEVQHEEINDEEVEELIRAFKQGLDELRYHSTWLAFSPQIELFVLKAGCPAVMDDPLDNIETLRTHVLANPGVAFVERHLRRPATRGDFEVAVICALTLEANAVNALFDHHWDEDGSPYDKAPSDPNAYSMGAVGRHNVVLAHMPGMGKANAAAVAANCRASFPNIKLAIVVGVCGAVPFGPNGEEIMLGDVVVSDGVVQYDLGRRLPERFVRKDTLLDSLGRPNVEIRSLLAKLKGLRGRKTLQDKMAGYMDALRGELELAAEYPGVSHDKLFEAAYCHVASGISCDECYNGHLVPRRRLEGSPQLAVHFGLIASGDTVMKSGEERDAVARQEGVVAFEMESAGVWDSFPCAGLLINQFNSIEALIELN